MKKFLLSLIVSATLAAAPLAPTETDEWAWKIGGKIHFQETDGADHLGLITLNQQTIAVLTEIFQVDKENQKCASNAKVLIGKSKAGTFFIGNYEEKKAPGVGEEMHATLLYTSKRMQNGHETLKDVYNNLVEIDENLPHASPPTVQQVASTYQKIINPDWKYEISEVVFMKGNTGNLILAKLLVNGKDEIVNAKGNSVSGNFLHISLAHIEPSALLNQEDEKKMNVAALRLNQILSGKSIKIASKNGQADLEFGISGSSPQERIRPACKMS